MTTRHLGSGDPELSARANYKTDFFFCFNSGGLVNRNLLKCGYLENGNQVFKRGLSRRHIPVLPIYCIAPPPPPPPGLTLKLVLFRVSYSYTRSLLYLVLLNLELGSRRVAFPAFWAECPVTSTSHSSVHSYSTVWTPRINASTLLLINASATAYLII